MSKRLDISDEHLKLVRQILQQQLSTQAHVWVFGSRATGTAQKYSDLDLLIDNDNQPLSLAVLSALAYEFDESALPYKVDIVDYATISSVFRTKIEHDKVLIVGHR